MCGISGIVAKNVRRYTNDQLQMVSAMNHRGPDANGVHFFDNCALGHNRLSIVDLTQGGQPMFDNTGSICVVFNGEIYGYKELRKKINYPFASNSDTELLLALYKKHGTGMLSILPGMFSFAIWDEEKQLLFAARDRFGEKPFFYKHRGGELVFASEIKGINSTSFKSTDVSSESITRFLNYGYTGPVSTIYTDIFNLPPAHYLLFENGRITIKQYWQLPETDHQLSLSEAAEKFEHLFRSAVEKQMIADVECCAFLSGGLDSTSVVSVAKDFNPALKTLCFKYNNQDSEVHYSKIAASKYHTKHIILNDQNIGIVDVLPELCNIYDEPFADSSAMATYLICKEASEYSKVVLTGDGADELLGGYIWWYRPVLEMIDKRKDNLIKQMFTATMAAGEKLAAVAIKSQTYNWRRSFNAQRRARKHKTPATAVLSRFNALTNDELQRLNLPSFSYKPLQFNAEMNMNDALKADITDYLPGDILVKTDRASMASSLELRAPFLDVDLASFCISMPAEFKITSKDDKILLRESMSRFWPAEIRKRSKQGFGTPDRAWVNSAKMNHLKETYLNSRSSALYKLLPYKETIQLIATKPQTQNSLLLMALWAARNI